MKNQTFIIAIVLGIVLVLTGVDSFFTLPHHVNDAVIGEIKTGFSLSVIFFGITIILLAVIIKMLQDIKDKMK